MHAGWKFPASSTRRMSYSYLMCSVGSPGFWIPVHQHPLTPVPTWVDLPRPARTVLHHRRKFPSLSPSRPMHPLIVTCRDTTTAVLIRITYKDITIVHVGLFVFWVLVMGVRCCCCCGPPY